MIKLKEYKEYWNNGKLEQKGLLENGKKIGKWLSYRNNGTLWGKYYFKNNKLEGQCLVYNMDGNLWKKIYYKNGQEIKKEKWLINKIKKLIKGEIK